jgi:hypothetical protein
MIRKKGQENHRKSRFKERRYSYELWKLIQKFKNFQKETIDIKHRKLKWNDYKLIRKMFPHGTTYP